MADKIKQTIVGTTVAYDANGNIDPLKAEVFFEDGSSKLVLISDIEGKPEQWQEGAEIMVDVSTLINYSPEEAEETATTSTSTSTSTGTSTGTNKPGRIKEEDLFTVPDKYKEFFRGIDGRTGKRILYMPDAGSHSVQEKEEFTKWLDDNRIYDQVIQNSTEGYKVPGMENIFYGGLGPEDFEYKFMKGWVGADNADKMSEQERRDLFFQELGIPDEYIGQGKEIYNKPEFRKLFLEKYQERLPNEEYRQIDDEKKKGLKMFGWDHYDTIKKKYEAPEIKEEDTPSVDDDIKVCPCTDPETGYEVSVKPIPVIDANGVTRMECPPCEEADVVEEYGDPGKFFLPDMVNYMAAATQQDDPTLPYLIQTVNPDMEIAYEDYATQVANQHDANQQLLEQIENMTNTGQGGVGAAITAIGNNINQTTQTISDVHNRNINRFNEFSRFKTGVEDRTNVRNKEYLKNFIDELGAFRDNRQAFKNQKKAGKAAAFNKMWENEMYASGIEEMNPDAKAKHRWDPSSWVSQPGTRKVYDPYDTYVPSYGAGPGYNTVTAEDMAANVNTLMKDYNMSQDNATKLVEGRYKYNNRGRGRNRGDAYLYGRGMFGKDGGIMPFGTYLTGGIFE